VPPLVTGAAITASVTAATDRHLMGVLAATVMAISSAGGVLSFRRPFSLRVECFVCRSKCL
jgi:hypothetical protein